MGIYKKVAGDNEPISFSDTFWEVLDAILDETNSPGTEKVVWDLQMLDGNYSINNALGIEELDLSNEPSKFDAKRFGKTIYFPISIESFFKNYFPGKHSSKDINDFIKDYNNVIGESEPEVEKELIQPRPFKFEPLNVKDTFISLVTETYPMGHEDELLPYITPGLKKDKFGNYYTVIGNPDVAFTSHLDTASKTKSKVGLIGFEKDGDFIIKTDEKSILGADDKAGVTVMMYMIANRIPGVYWFFYGEERGGQGSSKVANNYQDYPFMRGIKKMVSFDRRNYFSVITSQLNLDCCSNEFALELCEELNSAGLKMNLDPTGVFTDSANFIDLIPECTNVSVGYFHEHTHDEMQNISFLEKLAKACVQVNWSGLKVYRNIQENVELSVKYSRLLKSLRRASFYNKDTIKIESQKVIFTLEINSAEVNSFCEDIEELQYILAANKLNPDIHIDDNIIKIILT